MFENTVLKPISAMQLNAGTCFISRADNDPETPIIDKIVFLLKHAGIKMLIDNPDLKLGAPIDEFLYKITEKLPDEQYVVKHVFMMCTEFLYSRSCIDSSGVSKEVRLIEKRLSEENATNPSLTCVLLSGDHHSAVPLVFSGRLHTGDPIIRNGALNSDRLYTVIIDLLTQKIFPEHQDVQRICQAFRGQLTTEPPKPLELTKAQMGLIISPLPRLQHFVQAESEVGITYLQKIKTIFHEKNVYTSCQQCVLTGTGGIGKTTLALAYTYQASKRYANYDLIYWIPAESITSIMISYREILKKINQSLNPDTLDDAGIRKAVVDGLYCYRAFLVFDNVPPEYCVSGCAVSAEKFFFDNTPTDNTDILITSRSQLWEECHNVQLNTMSVDEAIRLIKGTFGNDKEQARVQDLVKKLGCLPLALAYASAYIKVKRISIDVYLQTLSLDSPRILNYKPIVTDYPHALSKVWSMTEMMLSDGAKDFLLMCSYLEPDKILAEFFLSDNGSYMVEKTIEELEKYSLIQCNRDKSEFSVHRLLQLVNRIKNEENERHFKQKIANILDLYEKKLSHSILGRAASPLKFSELERVYNKLDVVFQHLEQFKGDEFFESIYAHSTWFRYYIVRQMLTLKEGFFDEKVICQKCLNITSDYYETLVFGLNNYGHIFRGSELFEVLYMFKDFPESQIGDFFSYLDRLNVSALLKEEKVKMIRILNMHYYHESLNERIERYVANINYLIDTGFDCICSCILYASLSLYEIENMEVYIDRILQICTKAWGVADYEQLEQTDLSSISDEIWCKIKSIINDEIGLFHAQPQEIIDIITDTVFAEEDDMSDFF